MSKVNEKNTKKEILEALKQVEAQLENVRKVNTTTADTVKAKEVVAKKEAAKELVEMNILNGDIVSKYNSLLETVDMLEKEIEELHQVKAGFDTLEALIIVQNNKKAEFEAESAQKLTDLTVSMQEKRDAVEKQIAELKGEYEKATVVLKENYIQAKKELERDRKREAEEFAYNLKRERAIENNAWEDEKAAREKALTDRENAVAQREAVIGDLNTTIEKLTAELTTVQESAKEAIANALKEGEAKAEKTCAIKTAAVKRDAEWQTQVLEKEISSLRTANDEKIRETAELRAKLDDAYTRIQEMALEQAKASSPRIIESNTK